MHEKAIQQNRATQLCEQIRFIRRDDEEKLENKRKRVLVVDDDKSIGDLTQLMLRSAGYECTVLHSGRECLEKLKSAAGIGAYDLILLDVAMPGFSGIDVISALNKQGTARQYKIVFFTASITGSLEEPELRKLGALDCIRKPFSKAGLLEKVDQAIKETGR